MVPGEGTAGHKRAKDSTTEGDSQGKCWTFSERNPHAVNKGWEKRSDPHKTGILDKEETTGLEVRGTESLLKRKRRPQRFQSKRELRNRRTKNCDPDGKGN